jgi:hypothetical protein
MMKKFANWKNSFVEKKVKNFFFEKKNGSGKKRKPTGNWTN